MKASKASIKELWEMEPIELIVAHDEARRQYAETKFTRDTEAANLAIAKAERVLSGEGTATDPVNAAATSKAVIHLAQEVRVLTRDVAFRKIDADTVYMVARARGIFADKVIGADDDDENA